MKERYHSEDPGVDERITTEWILGKWSKGPEYRPEAGSCKHGNEPLDSIAGWEFLD
jgi:hypothetical protein